MRLHVFVFLYKYINSVKYIMTPEITPEGNLGSKISTRIKEVRGVLGLTQKELCEKIGMKLPSLRDYELGNRIPGGDALTTLVSVGINANWLLSGEGAMLLIDDKKSQGDPTITNPALPDERFYMAGWANTAGKAVHGNSIDFNILTCCYSACLNVYGEKFIHIEPVLQMEYAVNLYNLLVNVSLSNGGKFEDMIRLEVKGLVEQLNVFIKLRWAKKFPPPPPSLIF
jgi:transcriptional regulator with XRE-family HTH domain